MCRCARQWEGPEQDGSGSEDEKAGLPGTGGSAQVGMLTGRPVGERATKHFRCGGRTAVRGPESKAAATATAVHGAAIGAGQLEAIRGSS